MGGREFLQISEGGSCRRAGGGLRRKASAGARGKSLTAVGDGVTKLCSMGNGGKLFDEVGEAGSEGGSASRSCTVVGYGEETFSRNRSEPSLSNGGSIRMLHLPCQAGDGEKTPTGHVCEAGCDCGRNGAAFPSPRLSFSCDFAATDSSSGKSASATQCASFRFHSEENVCNDQDDHFPDFEFSPSNFVSEGAASPATGVCMLPADELFCDGKLVPLRSPSNQTLDSNIYSSALTLEHLHDPRASEMSACRSAGDGSRSTARHLNFDIDRPRACTGVAIASSSQTVKHSLKIRDVLKPKGVSTGRLSNFDAISDSSFAYICGFPIFPRSFWPFSSRNAYEKEADFPMFSCWSILKKAPSSSLNGSDSRNQASQTGRISTGKVGYIDTIDVRNSGVRVREMEEEILRSVASTKAHLVTYTLTFDTANANDDLREDVIQSSVLKLKEQWRSDLWKNGGRATRSLTKGSPGRRGSVSSNKIVLRNLERCSTKTKLGKDGWRGLDTRGPYLATFGVAPILNVAVSKGGSTVRNGLLGFSNLFSSTKNAKKALQPAVNWRRRA